MNSRNYWKLRMWLGRFLAAVIAVAMLAHLIRLILNWAKCMRRSGLTQNLMSNSALRSLALLALKPKLYNYERSNFRMEQRQGLS